MSIWDFKELKNSLKTEPKAFVTLNECNTPAQRFKIHNVEVILKREGQNPSKSWKDRATAYKLTKLLSENINEGVISTSGNAAISYLTYIKYLNLPFKLHVVLSKNVNEDKFKILNELVNGTKNQLYIVDNPKKKTVELSATLKIKNLKSVIDEDSVKAYWSLGFELAEFLNPQESNLEVGVFIPASSGTGFVGTAQGLFMKLGNEYLMPRMFVCQTSKVHTFYNALKNITDDSKTSSLADAIIDTSGLRAPQVLKVVKESSGDALKIGDEEIQAAEKIMNTKDIKGLSYNSLISIAGFLQIKDSTSFKKVICIASGR